MEYTCESCNCKLANKTNYDKHIRTATHIKKINSIKKKDGDILTINYHNVNTQDILNEVDEMHKSDKIHMHTVNIKILLLIQKIESLETQLELMNFKMNIMEQSMHRSDRLKC